MSTLYTRKIINDPETRLSYSDPLIGLVRGDELTLELSNTDGYFDSLDLRGEHVDFARFEKFTQENLAELSGSIVSQELKLDKSKGAYVSLRVMSQDIAELQTLIPKRLVTATTFPVAHPDGLNRVIPIVFGQASGFYELPYVGENIGANQYDYLLGEGTFANVTIYRNTVGGTLMIVPGAEYAINTAAYPGFTVARFALRQAQFSGGLHRLYASVDGLATERNFVRAVQAVLTSTTWGLGLTVDTTAFTAAAAVLDGIGSLFCDGVMYEQRPALDYLNQLLIVRGMRLHKTSAGVWTISVDQSLSTIQAQFGHGIGQQWANTTSFGGIKRTPVSEAVKTLYLDYFYDRMTKKYTLSTSARSVLSVGKERRIEHDFIRNTTTGDKTACYIAKKLIAIDTAIVFEGGQEARKLIPGDLIRYESMRPAFTTVFQIQGLRRVLATTAVDGLSWDATPFTYDAGTLPTAPALPIDTDYTRQTPTAASSLSIASSGVEADGQGGFAAFVVLQYTVPVETWAQTFVRRRKNATTPWETVATNQETGAGKQTRFTGLITGMAYDYRVSRVNATNPSLSADADLTNQTAPADTSGPAAPTSLVITDQHLKTIMVEFANSDADVKYWHWEIRTAASGGGSLVDEGDTEGNGKQIKLTLNQIAYSTTRYLRVMGYDYSGNPGTYSASLSFSFSQIVTGDVTPDAITVSGLYSTDATYSLPLASTEYEVGSLTITGEAGTPLLLIASIQCYFPGTASDTHLWMRKDSITGTLLAFSEILYVQAQTTTLIGYDPNPSASQTYKLVAWSDTGLDVITRRLVAFNLKR